MNLMYVFLTGLTTGGITCLAMQGGLLASVIANQKEQELETSTAQEKRTFFTLRSFDQLDWLPVTMFLVSKLVSHTVLGFLLGLLGSTLTLSLGLRLGFQLFTALFMFGTAMNLLNVHPLFRYLAFQPPKFLQRLVRNTSKSKALFAPMVLGFVTIFIPCGVTQAMEVIAINSGSPVYGALIMFSFVLGTSPLFALLGLATAKLSEGWYASFTKVAAAVLIIMAGYSLNGVLVVMNSPITLSTLTAPVSHFFSADRFASAESTRVVNGVQQVTINIFNNGYSPKNVVVKKGVPVELTLTSNDTYSCALSFILKEFNINTFLEATDSQTFTFTPTKAGKYPFTCSMGMYSGTLEVI